MFLWHCINAVCAKDIDGSITAVLSNPAINLELLSELKSWYAEGASVDDIIERLRLQTVPPGYAIHSWIEGTYFI